MFLLKSGANGDRNRSRADLGFQVRSGYNNFGNESITFFWTGKCRYPLDFKTLLVVNLEHSLVFTARGNTSCVFQRQMLFDCWLPRGLSFLPRAGCRHDFWDSQRKCWWKAGPWVNFGGGFYSWKLLGMCFRFGGSVVLGAFGGGWGRRNPRDSGAIGAGFWSLLLLLVASPNTRRSLAPRSPLPLKRVLLVSTLSAFLLLSLCPRSFPDAPLSCPSEDSAPESSRPARQSVEAGQGSFHGFFAQRFHIWTELVHVWGFWLPQAAWFE